MSSPIASFLHWYHSLPVTHREEIAAWAGMSMPGYSEISVIDGGDVVVEKFVRITEAFQAEVFREIGAVVALRGYLQFFFIDQRKNRAEMREVEADLNALAQVKDLPKFEKLAIESRFKLEQWITTCEKWGALVTDHLSDAHLRRLLP